MLIKFLLLGLTIVLLANEHFHFIDEANKKLRSTVLLSIFILVTILSIIDLYNDNEDFNKLETKSEEIFEKSEEILKRVEGAVSGIEESKTKIKVLDSLALQTNNRLDIAIEKSKELSDIEKDRFDSERARLMIVGGADIKIDSNGEILKADIVLTNMGKRAAIKAEFHARAIFFNSVTNQSTFIVSRLDNMSTGFNQISDFLPSTKTKITFRPDINTSRFRNSNDEIIFIISLKYSDEFSGSFTQTLVMKGKGLENNKLNFSHLYTSFTKNLIIGTYEVNGLNGYLFFD